MTTGSQPVSSAWFPTLIPTGTLRKACGSYRTHMGSLPPPTTAVTNPNSFPQPAGAQPDLVAVLLQPIFTLPSCSPAQLSSSHMVPPTGNLTAPPCLPQFIAGFLTLQSGSAKISFDNEYFNQVRSIWERRSEHLEERKRSNWSYEQSVHCWHPILWSSTLAILRRWLYHSYSVKYGCVCSSKDENA